MDSDLIRRVGFAAVAIPLTFLLVWYGGAPLALLLTLSSVLATRELFGLARRVDVRPAAGLGLLSAGAVAPLTYAALSWPRAGELAAEAWP
ncbi:MAG: hypothetical protein H0T68_12730, partial [Gemmatimonadales bacterium]|nr:hypothetical protein [Gemmatimonadales bacterium]